MIRLTDVPVVTHLVERRSKPRASRRTSASSCARARASSSAVGARLAESQRGTHPYFAADARGALAHYGAQPSTLGVSALPARPQVLRRWHCRRALARARHRRARDLEPHARRAFALDAIGADGASTGSTVPRGSRAASASGAITFDASARDRELDGRRARAASAVGLPRRRPRVPQRAAAEPEALRRRSRSATRTGR